MGNRTKRGTINIPLCMALVLFWLVAITTYLTGGLYARYVTTDTGADDARVAQFGLLTLTETGDFENGTKTAMIIPGIDLTKDAHVSFAGSEMSTVVFVEVIVSDHWQRTGHAFTSDGQMHWSVAKDWTYLLSDTYEGKNRHVFYITPQLNTPLEADIVADNGKITVSSDITEENIQKLEGTSISFRASVIQNGGFESPQAAWDAVKVR